MEQGDAGKLVISEVVTSNGASLVDEKYGSPDWIELYNDSSQDINLNGYIFTDKPGNMSASFLLPNVVVPAGGYLILYANSSLEPYVQGGAICLNFSLSRGGDMLVLADNRSNIVQELDVPQLERDVSYARREDGTYGFCSAPTPGVANTTDIFSTLEEAAGTMSPDGAQLAGDSPIVINEVVSKNVYALPMTCCVGGDWVELHNTSAETIALTGFALADKPAKVDASGFQGAIIAGGAYLLVHCCRDGCDKSDGHVCVRMGIQRAGAELFLYDGLGQLVCLVKVPLLSNDVSWARRADGTYGFCGQPTPGAENTTNITDSIEPIPMGTDAPIRISEVLPKNKYSIMDADGDRSDWVELLCVTPGASLSGYYLSDDINNPRKWQIPETAFGAGGYLLIFLSSKNRAEGELHAGFSISAGETLVLFDSNTNTMDTIPITELRAGVSIGWGEDGEIVYYGYPTPNAKNAHPFKEAEQIGFFQTASVFISEVSATHESGQRLTDWIELYNGGGEERNLNGYYLSNDSANLKKWQFADLAIPSQGYVAVDASKHISRRNGNATTFGISSEGTTLILSDPNGEVVDVFETGVQRLGQTSGRLVSDNKIARVYFYMPTKGEANSDSYTRGYTAAPQFSETGLYQNQSFSLSLSCATGGATIYYTTDGSKPTTDSARYTDSISIGSNAVIRAFSTAPGLLAGDSVTYHYLFEEPHTLPVVCVAMSPTDFVEVYQPKEHLDKVDRLGFVSYYEKDGLPGAVFPAWLKAKGRGTLGYPQKSFTLNLSAALGQSTVNYPFFPGYGFTEFSCLNIRNAGQDYDKGRIADPFASRVVQGMHIEAAATRPVVVYFNGKYYGIYDLGEELNANYLVTHYGVDKDMVELIRRNNFAGRGTEDAIRNLRAFADANNMSDQARYEEYCQWIDMEYFTDYYIARTFMCDTDMFNQKYWRTTDYSIKWRPVLYDLDSAFRNSTTRNIMDHYFDKGGVASRDGSLTNMNLFVALNQNEGWRNYCVERYVQVIFEYFNAERLGRIFDEMVAELEPEMSRHIARWKKPGSMSDWKENIAKMREYTQKRPAIALEQVQKRFRVSDARMQELIAKYGG